MCCICACNTVIYTCDTSICKDVQLGAINWDECPTHYKLQHCALCTVDVCTTTSGSSSGIHISHIFGIDSITSAWSLSLYLLVHLLSAIKAFFDTPIERTNGSNESNVNVALRCPAIELCEVYKYFIVHFIACAIKNTKWALRQRTTIKMQHACDALQLRCII